MPRAFAAGRIASDETNRIKRWLTISMIRAVVALDEASEAPMQELLCGIAAHRPIEAACCGVLAPD